MGLSTELCGVPPTANRPELRLPQTAAPALPSLPERERSTAAVHLHQVSSREHMKGAPET